MQQIFVAQIRVGCENKFIEKVKKIVKIQNNEEFLKNTEFVYIQRELFIRREGKNLREIQPMFPGYIFIMTENLSNDLIDFLRKTENFIRFLPQTINPQALYGNDLQIIQKFTEFGEILIPSKITFDENDRIVVKEGPLLGFEGNIIKVDRRKKRAKIKFDFASESFTIDLSFEVLEK